MTYDVFISYSRKDTEIVDYIESELRRRGITCFVDRSDIELGDDFAEVISKAIFESEILLFVWSENSNQSPNTANEIALAIDFEKTIISFKIGKFKPDYRLAYRLVRFNRIDALTYNRQQIIELADKVAKRLGKRPAPADTPTDAPQPAPTTPAADDDTDPALEPDYQEGIRALQQFKLPKAFSLLYPLALAEYRQAAVYLARITRGKTRMHKLDEQQMNIVKQDAENGIALAQYVLGCYYYQTGKHQPAFEWLKRAADQELTLAYGPLANCYDIGAGTPESHDKYLEYVRKGIAAKDIESMLLHARNLRNAWTVERDTAKAERMLLELEQTGDPRSLCELGWLYYNASDVPGNREKAIAYYRKAIELGWIESYTDLATTLGLDKHGNVTDGKRYMAELTKGAEYEEVRCMSTLAVAYYHGNGVKQNYKQALRWAEKAAQNGDVGAYIIIGIIYYYGNGVPADEPKAWQYFMEGRKRVSSECCYYLGLMCQDGYGQDGYAEADCVAFYEESVSLGNVFSDAAVRLYKIYSEGELVEKDTDKAIGYLQRAVDDNDTEAFLLYGKLLTDLDSDYCNEFKGVKYLNKAAEAGNCEAIYLLGDLYRQGIGVPEDREKAVEYVSRAADEYQYGRAQLAMADLLSHLPTNNEWYDEQEEKSLTPEQIREDRLRAAIYANQATDEGYNYGYLICANIYQKLALEENYQDESFNKTWFNWQTLAYKYFPEAAYALAITYEFGFGTELDEDKAMQLYEEDFDNGYARSAVALASIWAERGDLKKARKWLQAGADKGDTVAREKLEKLDKTGSL